MQGMLSSMKSLGVIYSTDQFLKLPPIAADLFPAGLEDLDEGLTMSVVLNIMSGSDPVCRGMSGVIDAVAGKPDAGELARTVAQVRHGAIDFHPYGQMITIYCFLLVK